MGGIAGDGSLTPILNLLVSRLLLSCLLLPCAHIAAAQDAEALRERHAAAREQLSDNPFGRPLYVASHADAGSHRGEVFATLAQPFDAVAPALRDIGSWCDILTLPANVKGCETEEGKVDSLSLFIAAKPEDASEDAFRVDFRFRVAAAAQEYFRVELESADGPFGTSDYRITLEAAPIGPGRTFMHMSYSYALGLTARLAMQAYLATTGRGKVGFSVVERTSEGKPVYVQGVRGVVERNAMRYYLAIEAYLDALDAPPDRRLERRLHDWYAGIERYPKQLDERIGREDYVRMKLAQAAGPQPASAPGASGASAGR